MPSPTRNVKGIVIGKTKLGESDLIVRLLADDGSLVEAVAKGARRPQGSLSGKIDLFNEVDVLISEGKGLGLVKECRLACAGPGAAADPVTTSAAATMAEFAVKTSQVGLEVPRYFDLMKAALSSIQGADPATTIALTAAYLLKGASILGARPHLGGCVVCGVELSVMDDARSFASFESVPTPSKSLFSYADGGVICRSCADCLQLELVARPTLEWMDWLIRSPFSSVREAAMGLSLASDALAISCRWADAVLGVRLRSVAMLEAFAAI